MARPRLLVVPTASSLEWPILPLLEEWADVAVAEGAWVEDGSAVRRATAELEDRGWAKATLVWDEWAVFKALEIVELRPDLVEALAFGHAATQLTVEGARPTLNPEVVGTYTRILQTDIRMWARSLTQTTRGDYDDALVDRFLENTPQEDFLATFDRIRARDGQSFVPALRSLDVPMLLARHTECLLWTEEGFRDAVSEFPSAATAAVQHKPSASPEFAEALREFCGG